MRWPELATKPEVLIAAGASTMLAVGFMVSWHAGLFVIFAIGVMTAIHGLFRLEERNTEEKLNRSRERLKP